MAENKIKRVNSLTGPCYFKMLINNSTAGAIIGKNGSVITYLEKETGCTLKLSHSNVYFPDTQDRILVYSGNENALEKAIKSVIQIQYDNFISESHHEGVPKEDIQATDNHIDTHIDNHIDTHNHIDNHNHIDTPNHNQNNTKGMVCKCAVPKSSVSKIIGKGGTHIQELRANTNAKIRISDRDKNSTAEGIITLSGSVESIQKAMCMIAKCIQNDPHLKDQMFLSYKNNDIILNPLVLPQSLLNRNCEIIICIPEDRVGAIIGKGGTYILEIMKQTHTKIQISQKGDFVKGTNNRKMKISGSVLGVHTAHLALLQRLESIPTAKKGVLSYNDFEYLDL